MEEHRWLVRHVELTSHSTRLASCKHRLSPGNRTQDARVMTLTRIKDHQTRFPASLPYTTSNTSRRLATVVRPWKP
jgi:hypothetical protein